MLKKIKQLIFDKYIILLNIIISILIFYITFCFQKYFYIYEHDYFWPYTNIKHFLYNGRILAFVSYSCIHNFLPQILNIHTQDFICGFGAIINSTIFSFLTFIVASSFFITSNRKNLFLNKETLIIMPLSFLFLCFPFMMKEAHSTYFGFLNESVTFFDYYLCILFYFILIYYIIKIQVDQELTTLNKFIFVLSSFIIGFWDELFNITVLLSAIFICIFFNKKLKWNYFKLFIYPFITGFTMFYIFSGWLSGNMGASHPQNWTLEITLAMKNLNHFLLTYINVLFFDKIYFYIFIFLILIFLLKLKDNKINIIVKVCFSFLLGYLVCNLSYIFFQEIAHSYNIEYLFQRNIEEYIYSNILEFITITFIGCLYFKNKVLSKYILVALVIVTLTFMIEFNKNYNIIQDNNKRIKLLTYKIEKINIIYNFLGESAILPASYLSDWNLRYGKIYTMQDNFKYRYKDNFEEFMKDKFFDSIYSLYYIYFEKTYNTNFFGFQFKDDNYANEEFNKRLKLLNEKDETDNDILNNGISFKLLNKYKTKKMSLDDVNKINKTQENYELLLKIKAFVNYRDGNDEEALKLYNEYLTINNNDFDALNNIANIYLKQKNFKDAEFILEKLHNLDNNNLTFLYKLLCINYYEKKDYKRALEISNLMIEQQKDMHCLYLNKGIIYYALNEKEKARNLFEYIEKTDNNLYKNTIAINDYNLIKPQF